MTLAWQWSVPAGHLPLDPDEMIQTCNAAGITALEGQVKAFAHLEDKPAAWDALAQRFNAAGVQVSTFHLPFSPTIDLASFYETARREAVEETRRWIEISVRLGCQLGVTHPTTSRYNAETEGLDRYLDQLSRTVEELLPTLQSHGYRIAIENMLPGPDGGRFGSQPVHFERMGQRFDSEHVGFCLDTGHALNSAPPEAVDEFIEAMSPRLIAYHLADNAGDRDSHLAPGRGLVDWPRVFTQMDQRGFDGHACIETPPFAPGPAYSVDAWRRHLEETTELAHNALEAKTARS